MPHINPERAAFEAFKALPRNEPIAMLNLVAVKERAEYAPGFAGAAERTGAEAYAEYGRVSAPIFSRIGGSVVWRGDPKVMLIGPQSERWDFAFVAAYPEAARFLEMVTDPAYRNDAVPHRDAAVSDSRLLRCAPLPLGETFA